MKGETEIINSASGISLQSQMILTLGGRVDSSHRVPSSLTSNRRPTGLPFTRVAIALFISSWLASAIHPKRGARVSSCHIRAMSLWVVTTGFAPSARASCRHKALAPPTCPDNTEITLCPRLSIQTTAGSEYLSEIYGAIDRTHTPRAPMKTIDSHS